MQFVGRVYFDFASKDVWTFFRFLGTVAAAGVELGTDWRPFAGNPEQPETVPPLAAYEAVRHREPDHHGGFLLALLTAVHAADGDATDPATQRSACASVGIDPAVIEEAGGFVPQVRASTAEAVQLGVTTTPTLYRHGPVLHVVLTPAALQGNPVPRLQAIEAVLEDDAIWRLEKP